MLEESNEAAFSFHRSEDRFAIEFLGGPLDGGRIETDEYPNCDYFVHRLGENQYCYRYHHQEGNRFRAEFDGPFLVDTCEEDQRRNETVRALVYFTAASLIAIVLLSLQGNSPTP